MGSCPGLAVHQRGQLPTPCGNSSACINDVWHSCWNIYVLLQFMNSLPAGYKPHTSREGPDDSVRLIIISDMIPRVKADSWL